MEISADVINKISHESRDIQIRALEQIESKLVRASEHKLQISFNPIALYKQLIRNFKNNSEKILRLLTLLLSSKYGEIIADSLGTTYLKQEIQSIRKLLYEDPKHLDSLTALLENLMKKKEHKQIVGLESEVNDAIQKLDISDTSNSCYDPVESLTFAASDYESAWSIPSVADYNFLKSLSDVLSVTQNNVDEILNVLQHFHVTMVDYPPEYLLQSPYIFIKVLKLFEQPELSGGTLENSIINVMTRFLIILQSRLIQQRKVDSFAIPAPISYHIRKKPNFQTKSQLKVQVAITLLLETFLQNISTRPVSIRGGVLNILKAIGDILNIFHMQKISIEAKIFEQVSQLINNLQKEYFNKKDHLQLARVKYLWYTFILHGMLNINSHQSKPFNHYILLQPALCDYTLQKNFPKKYNQMKALIIKEDSELANIYQSLDRWKCNIESAVELLLKHGLANVNERQAVNTILNNKIDDLISTLDTLKSLKLLNIIFNNIIEGIPICISKKEMRTQAVSILCQLLNLEHTPLKACVFQRISKAVKTHLNSLMNNKYYCKGIQNRKLLSSVIIGIPLDTFIVEQIIYQCSESDCEMIKENGLEIILLLLRARHFYDDSICDIHLDFFMPVFPLIQCLQDSLTALKNEVLHLWDPDTQKVPFLSLLRGNIGLLFVEDTVVRSEALTRIIFLLNSLPECSDYIPNLAEISDILPNDICILQLPRDFGHVFTSTQTNYDISTLHNLLALLDMNDIEPSVRKTTLMQLNIILKNWDLTAAFCDLDAHCLLLRVLESSLQKTSLLDYIESIIPTVSILTKLLIYDSNFRIELLRIPNVYVLLLRALFYFSQDIQVRQDVSICLFLLYFGTYIIVPRGGGHFLAPTIFSKALKNPLSCEFTSSINKKNETNQLHQVARKAFSNDVQWKQYIRQVIINVLFKTSFPSNNQLEQLQFPLDFCPTLLIQPNDLRIAKATDTKENIKHIVRIISNATDEKTLIKASNGLQFNLMLFRMENNDETQLPGELACQIFSALSKYLQVTPGNSKDFEVYACILDLFHFCVQKRFKTISENLINVLQYDSNHAMILMLQRLELPADFMFRISLFFVDLFAAQSFGALFNKRINGITIPSHLYKLFHNLMLQYFASRELQRVRCLLHIMSSLCSLPLLFNTTTVNDFRKSLLKLSISISSSTQTGAQCHRDVLIIYSKLFQQLSEFDKINMSSTSLKHLIGLAGHNDTTVRALAWLCISQIAHMENVSTSSKSKDVHTSGAQMLSQKIVCLPGDLIGCCLSTFLDPSEICVVRNFAGSIFVLLLNENCNFENAMALLSQHTFFSEAYLMLDHCVFDTVFKLKSQNFVISSINDHATVNKFVTCDLVNCLTRICFSLIQKNPAFVEELCETQLLLKLYEVMKIQPIQASPAYYDMCAQICQLYAACSKKNYMFLQRTLCHDERWLICFFDLLDMPSDIVRDHCFVYVLQLLLVLCREDFVYQKLCTYVETNTNVARKFFQRSLNINKVNSVLQRCALSLLSLLLIMSQAPTSYSQHERIRNFVHVLEKKISVTRISSTVDDSKRKSFGEENKENCTTNSNVIKNKIADEEEKETLCEYVLLDLIGIFGHFYPSNTCKFDQPPSPAKVQICETLSIVLKLSPLACDAAKNVKLFYNILHILTIILQDIGTIPTIFVRRFGEQKKLAVVKNFQLLFQVLLNWFSSNKIVFYDEVNCQDFCKILILIWPWLAHSSNLKAMTIKLCAFISERSLVVCRQFSTFLPSYSQSILQLIIKLTITETSKNKSSNTLANHVSVIRLALRVMMNCCACAEGRLTLVKEHTLDMFDTLYPLNIKSTKICSDIFLDWLRFWEMFSRYNEGGQSRHFNSLCDLINRSPPCSTARLLCLKIIRNMSFVSSNRSFLMSSANFLYVVDAIISQPIGKNQFNYILCEEQFIVCVILWQILSGGIKFVTRMRDTKLMAKIRVLRDSMLMLNDKKVHQPQKTDFHTDFINILDIVFTFFDD